MKKKTAILVITAIGFLLAITAGFYTYRSRKTNDNLPALSVVAQMAEADINKTVCGYRRNQLNEVWGPPEESSLAEDIWTAGDGITLTVNYHHGSDKAVLCGLSIALFPKDIETVELTFLGCADSEPRLLSAGEITAVQDWAASLDLDYREFEEGKSPDMVYSGGVGYVFRVNDETDTVFYRPTSDGDFVLKDGVWYEALSPSLPPVTESEGYR